MRNLFALALSLVSLCGAALAQPPVSLTPAQASEAVDAVAARVAQSYVFPEKRDAIVAAIKNSEAEGRTISARPWSSPRA